VVRVLQRTLAGVCPGAPTWRHQRRGWRAASVATANGACARWPHHPSQRDGGAPPAVSGCVPERHW